jgi:hypothetical protein
VLFVTVDYKAFAARMKRLRKNGASAREAYIVAVATSFLQNVVKFSPRDTNRYVRGWLEAGRGIGLSTSELPAIVNSKNRDKIVEAMVQQVGLLRRKEAKLMGVRKLWYEDSNRPRRGYFHTLNRNIEKATARAERAEEELRRFLAATGAVVMMRTTGAALNGYQRMLSGDAVNLTVRDKVYGGRGRIIRGNFVTGVGLHNLEPHCRVVEKYRRPAGRARVALAQAGLQKLKPVYVKRLAANANTVRDSRAGLARNGITV